ncbi:MAG: [Fe-Fe] hydrogenase large subunit C-terminal domain-containing protein [Hyphomicrobiales bacterium]
MPEKPFFHHALTVDKDICIGCSNCMKVCPTEAIRIKDGKANIISDRCVDCGYCYKACPVSAIFVEQNDLDEIFNYKVRVALVPSIFIGQFPEEIRTSRVNKLMEDIGFTHVFDVEHTVDFLSNAINNYIVNEEDNKPLISTFCPAIIRLVQVKFPSLIENLLPYKPPIDLAATYCRKMLHDRGYADEDIGLFYITPCAAKISAVKSPVGENKSLVNGVININLIYNRLYRIIKNDKTDDDKALHYPSGQLNKKAVLWSLTHGEAGPTKGRCLAIDGMENVIEFLDKIENLEIEGIDFLELRACDEGCAGGILNPSNRFLTVERLIKRADRYQKRLRNMPELENKRIKKYEDFLFENINIGKVEQRSMEKLDEDFNKAMEKMKKTQKLMCYLPGFDCGACGAPSCDSLAQDIAQGNATLSHCVFMQRMMEKHHKLSPDHSFKIIEKIWGKDRLNKNCNKKGATNENL